MADPYAGGILKKSTTNYCAEHRCYYDAVCPDCVEEVRDAFRKMRENPHWFNPLDEDDDTPTTLDRLLDGLRWRHNHED